MKQFTNYNFEFNKNEKKLLATFCRQALKQVQGDQKYFQEEKALRSIIDKLNAGTDIIKLTKDERTRLKFQLEQNEKFLNKQLSKSWFLKKWLYRSMLVQYQAILENHFRG